MIRPVYVAAFLLCTSSLSCGCHCSDRVIIPDTERKFAVGFGIEVFFAATYLLSFFFSRQPLKVETVGMLCTL